MSENTNASLMIEQMALLEKHERRPAREYRRY